MRQTRIVLIAISLPALLVVPAAAAWVPVGSPTPDAVAEVRVTGGSARLELLYELPGFTLETTADGATVRLAGRTPRQEAGRPELPMVPVTLAVPASGPVRLEFLEHVVREVPVGALAVSRGHVMRDRQPSDLPRPAALPATGPWPADAAEVAAEFDADGTRGVTIRLNPLRHDAVRGLLLVSERIRLAVVTDAHAPAATPDAALRRLFANPLPATDPAKSLAAPAAPRMLAVAPASLLGALDGFLDWKARRGIDVVVRDFAALGGTAADLRDEVAARYAEPAGLEWLVIVGDVEQIPALAATEPGVLSDQRYGMVAGDDLHPDVLVSRLPARTTAEVALQTARIVAYERDAAATDAWYAQAAGVASAEGSPADHERADDLRDQLLAHGFTRVDRLYESAGAGTGDVAGSLEDGLGFVNYLGHGSGTAWQSVPFDVGDVAALGNAGRWPWIVDASCSNGDLGLGTCLAESWLRAGTTSAPAGAVGVFAATDLVPWTPPTLLQAGVVDALTAGDERSLGELCRAGLARVLEIYAGLPVARDVVERYALLGDASLLVRARAPQAFFVGTPTALEADAALWELEVGGPAGSVVALSRDGVLYGRGVGDGSGRVSVELLRPLTDVAELDLTVTGPDMVAHLGTVEVGGVLAAAAVPPGIPGLRLLGNHPNPFNPRTTIACELERAAPVTLDVYDASGRRVRRLLDGAVLGTGRREIVWDGRDGSGRELGSGVYLYRLRTPTGQAVGRMTLLK